MSRRSRNPLDPIITAGLIFLAGFAVEIAADVWVVNHPAPNDRFARLMPTPVTHIRQYILPLGGMALSAWIFLRRAAAGGRDALWTIEAGGTLGEFAVHALRALLWTAVAITVFQTAAWLQCRLYGVFLP